MDFLSDVINSVNWETLIQLTMLALIVIAGPAVIFVLAFRNGDL
ncbi:MAG: photosystem II reaction center protein Ycf12 [Synechococcales cyanobacterium C42_A2020_086]|jgi:hypothetical protein|nr:photosystem II reaction center protein Ycf12 [Synechococcales cyanobacterium M58_A2018_015]MBF2075839.1 photosystem II reaction center protein Ycf12 [Synechococcales cyanobacterium C42_A2020_086]